MSRKSCVIYDSWADQMLNLPDELAGIYVKAILKYAIYGEGVEPDNPIINAMLVPVKKKLDEDAAAYAETIRLRSEAGKKGMHSRWHNRTITDDNTVITNDNNDKDCITNITVTDTVTDTEYKKKNNKKKVRPKFNNFTERNIDFALLEAEAKNV